MIERALDRLYRYCREHDWKGWDPYDGLNSRLFRALPFRKRRLFRLAWIQLFKRSPINLRPLAGVPKEENPKGLALFARGLLKLSQTGRWGDARKDADELLGRLKDLRSPGHDRWCWGYNFDWQGRAFFVERLKPNAVATTFAAHAFLDRYEATGGSEDLSVARSAGDFLLHHLNRSVENDGAICFSYTPFDRSRVYNINFLIAALLARLATLTGDRALAETARRALDFVLERQAPDGSWAYGEAPFQQWVDHFHTCYNLLALDDCKRHLDDDSYHGAIERGLAFYLDHLFRADGLPRPDTRADYPIDIHAVALALVTLSRFAERRPECRGRLEKIVEWAAGEMQDRTGYFYYQKRAHGTVRIPYMRWAQAWMFYALSLLAAPERS